MSYYVLGTEPHDLPSGEYSVGYFDEEMKSIVLPHRVNIDLNSRVQTTRMTKQIDLMTSSRIPPEDAGDRRLVVSQQFSPEAMPPSAATKRGGDVAEQTPSTEEHEEEPPEADSPGDVQSTVMLLKEQMKMRRQEQDFIRESLHTREMGEVYQLSAMHRREIAKIRAQAEAQSRQAYEQRMKELQRFHELVIEANDRYAEKVKNPSPEPKQEPKADIPSMVMAALGTVQHVADSYMNHKTDTMRLVTGDANRESPVKAAEPKTTEAITPLPPDHPLRDIPTKAREPQTPFMHVMNTALSVNDAELAQALSNPESALAFLQKLSQAATSPSTVVTQAIDEKGKR